jgi:hypothetical protein
MRPREQILHILATHREELKGLGVKSLALFGSVARNEAGPGSDVDLLVEFSQPVGIFEFLDLQEYLERILGRRVDLVTPDALKRQMREQILKEAVRAA